MALMAHGSKNKQASKQTNTQYAELAPPRGEKGGKMKKKGEKGVGREKQQEWYRQTFLTNATNEGESCAMDEGHETNRQENDNRKKKQTK
jgi:hypothetical protein